MSIVLAPQALPVAYEQILVGATQRRRGEFVAGREAAHRAMLALGARPAPVAQGPDGEPLFPLALRGSISHTRTHAAAIVGLANDFHALGIDLDDARPLGDAAANGVTWEAEVSRIRHAMQLNDRALAQNFAFSAKEAVYKCQYPLTSNAGLTQHQARLIPSADGAGLMRIAGWRVPRSTAAILRGIVVRRFVLDAQTIAVALASVDAR